MSFRKLIDPSLLAALLLACSLWFCLPCMAGDDTPYGAKSSEEARKHRIFVRAVRVTPSSFSWRGHTVSFNDVWLERSLKHDKQWSGINASENWLCCKLSIDGKREYGSLFHPSMFECRPDNVVQDKLGHRIYRHETLIKVSKSQKVENLCGLRSAPRINGLTKHVLILPSDILSGDVAAHFMPIDVRDLKSETDIQLLFHIK